MAAADDADVFIQKDACPFECCVYGVWQVVSDAKIYEKPSATAQIVGTLKAGSTVQVTTGEVHVIPGRARAVSTPHKSAASLDPDAEIEILDYLGEGYSRVRQGRTVAHVKIARTKERCVDKPEWRYCWAEVLREPITDWWVLLGSKSSHPKGWVRMQDGGLRANDDCS